MNINSIPFLPSEPSIQSFPRNYIVNISNTQSLWQDEVIALGIKIMDKVVSSGSLFRVWISNENQLKSLKDKPYVVSLDNFHSPFSDLAMQKFKTEFAANQKVFISIYIEDEMDRKKINTAIAQHDISIKKKIPLIGSEKWILEITSMKQLSSLSDYYSTMKKDLY